MALDTNLLLAGMAVLGGLAIVAVLAMVTVGAKASASRQATNEAGWKVECGRCKAVSGAGDAGMVRLGAASRAKRTLLKCPACEKASMMRMWKENEERKG